MCIEHSLAVLTTTSHDYFIFYIYILERSCGNPGSPTNGIKIGTNHSYGASIEFTCNQGYTLQGSQQRTCLTTGQWSGSQPTCQSKPYIS